MKTALWSLLFVTSLVSAGQVFADAQPAGCSFTYDVQIKSFFLVSSGSGVGVVECVGAAGQPDTTAAVKIEIEGIGPGFGEFNFKGAAGNIGIFEPAQLEGTYAVIGANVALGVGGGVNLGFKGQQNGLSFTASANGGEGFGIMVNGTVWKITVVK